MIGLLLVCGQTVWRIASVMSHCHADLRGCGGKCVCVAPCLWGARNTLVYTRRVAGVLYISLISVHLHLHTLTSADLPLYLHTPTRHLHIYITPAHPHCHSFTSALSFSLSTYLFSYYFKSNFFATSYSVTDCVKKSWLLDNSILSISLLGTA